MSRRRDDTTAWPALHSALAEMGSEGRWPVCANPSLAGLWISEDRAERVEAELWCVGCPILGPCGAAATASAEGFGVWGGVDRTPRAGRVAA